MNNLTITLVQSSLLWEAPENNRKKFTELLTTFTHKTDIVILPEMFTTGFSMSPEKVAQKWPGETIDWMKNESSKNNFAICGSIMTCENDNFYNRFVWVTPEGHIQHYDKKHLFRMGDENQTYHAGTKPILITYKNWKIAPFICYDLRFPVWSRNTTHYDLAIYVANWPAPRYRVWEKLLMARAIENQCYVAGVNRVGTDGRQLKYSGNSMLVNPRGEPDLYLTPGIEEIKSIELSHEQLTGFRAKFPVLKDTDPFTLK